MLYQIQAKLRRFIRGNILLYKFQLNYRQPNAEINPHRLIDSKRDICLEGYPRSANSYVNSLLKVLKPNLKIGGHTHSIVNLKLAFRNNIPIFILIRKPIDAIASFVLRRNELICKNNKKNIIFAIEDYKQFYEFVLKNQRKLVILDFDKIINEPEYILKIIELNSNLKMLDPKIDPNIDIDKATEIVFERLKQYETQNRFKVSSVPDKRRIKHIKELKNILKNNYDEELNKLNNLYNLLKPSTYNELKNSS